MTVAKNVIPFKRDKALAAGYMELEPDICDLVRAAEIAAMMFDKKPELTNFMVDQFLRMANELQQKYYALLPD